MGFSINNDENNYPIKLNTGNEDGGKCQKAKLSEPVFDFTYEEKNEPTIVAEIIYQDIAAKNIFGLPTTGENFAENVKKITSSNVYLVLKKYRELYGQNLDVAIKNEWGLDKKTKQEALIHIEKCMEELIKYDKNFKNDNTKIENEYYVGEEYSVEQEGEILFVKNKRTDEEYQLDLAMLTEDLPILDRVQMKQFLQLSSGEILADIAMELSRSFNTNDTLIENWIDKMRIKAYGFNTPKISGYYEITDDYITISSVSRRTIVHELGHAMDYNGEDNESSVSKNMEFMIVYQEEMSAYLADGNKAFSGENDVSNYATRNENEMFAECYSLIMNGFCDSQTIIEKYFPKTLAEAKKHIEYVRSLPREERISND